MKETYPNEVLPAQPKEISVDEPAKLTLRIISFGYKQGPPPPESSMVFDVRFLKNPFWVDELRPLTGLHHQVQEYVLVQPLAQDFLLTVSAMIAKLLPEFAKLKVKEFTVALGCTGGQHRSCALVEALADELSQVCPDYQIVRHHRELTPQEDKT
jgi:UPF0042 nucleotide-binding protein